MVLAAGLFFNGSTIADEAAKNVAAPKVQELIDKHRLEVVDYAYTRQAIGNGTRSGASALLIDARPHLMYQKGTIPSSISIPDTQIEDYIGQLDKVAKDKEIIVFCGGWKCEKSPIVAAHLQKKGFTDVKLYQAGTPEWVSKSYKEVDIPVVASAMEKDGALLMDARPRLKYLAETIPGALSMYDKDLERLAGRFPVDKTTPIIAFCGGYNCDKSHIVADMLLEQGYSNVSVFAAGLPGWKKSNLPTTAGGGKVASDAAPAEDVFVDGVKVGVDEGTVDGKWYHARIKEGNLPANIALIDVRSPADFNAGHMSGSINIEVGDLNAAEFMSKLPNDKVSIFACGSGARAMEAYYKLKEAEQDVSKIMYFDANISCDADNSCTIEVNEPLG
jgi:rhodanese-related sulfurtransferase